MTPPLRALLLLTVVSAVVIGLVPAADKEIRDEKKQPPRKAEPAAVVSIDTPLSPPTWALLERQLLQANSRACRLFYDRYFDERGYFECVERWGGDDGPDDAIENC